MKEYLQSADEVLSAQKSSPAGLSTADAGQRLEKFGKNKLAEAKKNPCCTNSSLSLPTP